MEEGLNLTSGSHGGGSWVRQYALILAACKRDFIALWLFALLWLALYVLLNLPDEDLHHRSWFVVGLVAPFCWWLGAWMQIIVSAIQGKKIDRVRAFSLVATRVPLMTGICVGLCYCLLTGGEWLGSILSSYRLDDNVTLALAFSPFWLVLCVSSLILPRVALDDLTLARFLKLLPVWCRANPKRALAEPLMLLLGLLLLTLLLAKMGLLLLVILLLPGWSLLAATGAVLLGLESGVYHQPGHPLSLHPEFSSVTRDFYSCWRNSSGLWVRLVFVLATADFATRSFISPEAGRFFQVAVWSWAICCWLVYTHRSYHGQRTSLLQAWRISPRDWIVTAIPLTLGLLPEIYRFAGSPLLRYGHWGICTAWWFVCSIAVAGFLSLSIPYVVLDGLGLDVAGSRALETAATNLPLVATCVLSAGLCAFGLEVACEWLFIHVVYMTTEPLLAVGGQFVISTGHTIALGLFWPLAFALHWHLSGAEARRMEGQEEL